MGSWLEVAMVIVTYCSGDQIKDADKCRIQRMECMKRAVVVSPKTGAEDLLNVCLSSQNAFKQPIPSPEPELTAVPTNLKK